ncbi:TBKB1 protein, partial [Myiagra hebetior]|nr:TBKB1 protein [Myiagra hebetior]
MDSMFEDDISILTQEALGPDEDWLDSPNTDLSGEMCSASHFALITAYDDIKNRLTGLERENSTLKRRLKMYEVKECSGLQDPGARLSRAFPGSPFPSREPLGTHQGILVAVTASTPLQKDTPKSVLGEGRITPGEGAQPCPLPVQRALVETHLSRIRSLEQQLRQRDSGAFPGLGTQDVPFIALHPNPGLSHVLERAGGWQSRGLEAELEAARQENQRSQHREEQLKAECE